MTNTEHMGTDPSGGPRLSASRPYVLVFDGGSKGNPGRGYGSYRLTSPSGDDEIHRLDFSDRGALTNNQAEYLALIQGLQTLLDRLGAGASGQSVRVEGDSQLIINQLLGTWKLQNEKLKPLHRQASRLLRQFQSHDLTWHPRKRTVGILGH